MRDKKDGWKLAVTLQPGEKIVVGLSGGADSVALTHCLVAMGCQVTACHVNHCLRGEESEADQRFVEKFCRTLGIPLSVRRYDVKALAKAAGCTVEEMGRKCRYEAFESVRKESGSQYVATAHTLSDQTETVFFHFLRGSGLRGLTGIPVNRGNIIRPFLTLTRPQTEAYCRRHGLEYVRDSSNLSDVYTRNRLRHRLIPLLRRFNPNLEQTVLRQTKTLLQDEDCLSAQAQAAADAARTPEGSYRLEVLQPLHPALRARALIRFLDENRIPRNAALLEKLSGMIEEGRGKLTVEGGRVLTIRGELLRCENETEPDYFEQPLHPGEWTAPDSTRYRISVLEGNVAEIPQKFHKKDLFLSMDYDKITGNLTVRQRQQGDRFRPSHRKGSRSLKKLFIEKKLSGYEKASVPVLTDDVGIVAVFGFGVDERVAVSPGTRRVLTMERMQ